MGPSRVSPCVPGKQPGVVEKNQVPHTLPASQTLEWRHTPFRADPLGGDLAQCPLQPGPHMNFSISLLNPTNSFTGIIISLC